jgi:hypothetical protein
MQSAPFYKFIQSSFLLQYNPQININQTQIIAHKAVTRASAAISYVFFLDHKHKQTMKAIAFSGNIIYNFHN